MNVFSEPSWLSPKAKKEWSRVVRILKDQGTLIGINPNSIGIYCNCFADYMDVLEYIADEAKKSGRGSKGILLITTSNGDIIQNPIIGIKNKALKRLCEAVKNIGLPQKLPK